MPPRAAPRHRAPTPPPRRRRVISPRPRFHEEEEKPEAIATPAAPLASFDHQPMHHEEKRRLILAHADARKQRPKGFSIVHYMAITASCLVVMAGWWMTMDRNFTVPASSSGSFTEVLHSSLQVDQIPAPTPEPTTPLDHRMEVAQHELRQQAAQDQVMDRTARRLLQPLSSSTASTTPSTR